MQLSPNNVLFVCRVEGRTKTSSVWWPQPRLALVARLFFGLLSAPLVHDRAAYAVVLCAASLHKWMLNTKVGPALDGWRLKPSLSCRDDRDSHAISPSPNDPRFDIDIINIQRMIKDFPTHKNIFYCIVKVPVDCFAIDKAVGGIGKTTKANLSPAQQNSQLTT